MNPRYLSELGTLEGIPKSPEGSLLDPRTLSLESQESAKERWRPFLSKNVQRLHGSLVEDLRLWAFSPPSASKIPTSPDLSKIAPKAQRPGIAHEEFDDDDLPRFSVRPKVYMGAQGELIDGQEDPNWWCSSCGGLDFVPVPERFQLQYHQLVHCARCRPYPPKGTPVKYVAVPQLQVKEGISPSTWGKWGLILLGFVAVVLFMTGLLWEWTP